MQERQYNAVILYGSLNVLSEIILAEKTLTERSNIIQVTSSNFFFRIFGNTLQLFHLMEPH